MARQKQTVVVPTKEEIARKAKREKTKQLAKTLYKEIFPNASLSCMSGYSGMFERFIKLAEKLENGDLTGTGIGRV